MGCIIDVSNVYKTVVLFAFLLIPLLERGHIALEEDIAQIAAVITRFILASVTQRQGSR